VYSGTDFGEEVAYIERHARRMHADVYTCTERAVILLNLV